MTPAVKVNETPFLSLLNSFVFIEQFQNILKADINNDLVFKTEIFNRLLQSPTSFRSQASRNPYAAVLLLVAECGVSVDSVLLVDLVLKSLDGILTSNEHRAVVKSLYHIKEYLSDESVASINANVRPLAKHLLINSEDLVDIGSTINVVQQYGFDCAELFDGAEGDDDVLERISDVVSGEAESMLDSDISYNNAVEPDDVEVCLRKIKADIHSTLSNLKLNIDLVSHVFRAIDPEEVAYKNHKRISDSEEYANPNDYTAGVSDLDIDHVFAE